MAPPQRRALPQPPPGKEPPGKEPPQRPYLRHLPARRWTLPQPPPQPQVVLPQPQPPPLLQHPLPPRPQLQRPLPPVRPLRRLLFLPRDEDEDIADEVEELVTENDDTDDVGEDLFSEDDDIVDEGEDIFSEDDDIVDEGDDIFSEDDDIVDDGDDLFIEQHQLEPQYKAASPPQPAPHPQPQPQPQPAPQPAPQPPQPAPEPYLSDDSVDSNLFRLSEDEDEYSEVDVFDEKTQIISRGPFQTFINSDEMPFDKTCIFGNYVELNYQSVTTLTSIAKELPTRHTKDYVCTLTKENVMHTECHLDFTPDYTSAYLMRFLMDPNALRLGIPARTQVISVVVFTPTCNVRKYCRLKFGEEGKAMVYSQGWTLAVQAFNLKEGDICVFRFFDDRLIPKSHRDPFGWLRMEIIKIGDEASTYEFLEA